MKTKNLQVNDMLFILRNGEEITDVFFECKDGHTITRIAGFTPSCEFITTYYPEITVSQWIGHDKDDVWTSQENYNIITCYNA